MEKNCRDCGNTFETKDACLNICYECFRKAMKLDEEQPQEWVWQSGHYSEDI